MAVAPAGRLGLPVVACRGCIDGGCGVGGRMGLQPIPSMRTPIVAIDCEDERKSGALSLLDLTRPRPTYPVRIMLKVTKGELT